MGDKLLLDFGAISALINDFSEELQLKKKNKTNRMGTFPVVRNPMESCKFGRHDINRTKAKRLLLKLGNNFSCILSKFK